MFLQQYCTLVVKSISECYNNNMYTYIEDSVYGIIAQLLGANCYLSSVLSFF